MSDVRSQRLFHYVTPDLQLWMVWNCPTGMVTLVKGLVIQNASAVQGVVGMNIWTPTGGLMSLASRTLQSGEGFHDEPWVVLNPGDRMYVASNPAGVHFWGSGAVLQGGPPVPPMTPVPGLEFEPLPAPLKRKASKGIV